MTEKPLTKKQRTILEAILFLIGKGELPTVREVGSLVGLRSPATVLKHLRVLEKASLISVSGKSRGIRISDPELLERVIQDTADEIVSRTPNALSGPPGGPRSRFSSSRSLSSTARTSEAGAPMTSPLSPMTSSTASPAKSPEVRSPETTSSGRPLGDVLQSHLPSVARLTSHGFLAFPRPPDKDAAPPRRIPLVGAIAAGAPFESYSDGYVHDKFGFEDSDDYGCGDFPSTVAPPASTTDSSMLGIDPKVFCDSGDVLALKVEGDSMVNVGILDGDYAIIRRQNTVEEGEIAAVIIDGEGTLKRWGTRYGSDPNRKTSVSLGPENDNFDPIEISEDEGKDVLVIGKYIGLIRGIQPLL